MSSGAGARTPVWVLCPGALSAMNRRVRARNSSSSAVVSSLIRTPAAQSVSVGNGFTIQMN
jgi:hypothetical protein